MDIASLRLLLSFATPFKCYWMKLVRFAWLYVEVKLVSFSFDFSAMCSFHSSWNFEKLRMSASETFSFILVAICGTIRFVPFPLHCKEIKLTALHKSGCRCSNECTIGCNFSSTFYFLRTNAFFLIFFCLNCSCELWNSKVNYDNLYWEHETWLCALHYH